MLFSLLFSRPVVSNFLQPHNCSIPGLPVPHHPLEFAQVHVDCISDAIQPSHPLMSSSPSGLNLFQHQELFQWVISTSDDQNTGASASASVLPVNIQGWYPFRLIGFIFLLSRGLSRVFSSPTVWRYQFFDVLPSLHSSSHNHMRPQVIPQPWLYRPLSAEYCLCF